MTVHERSRDHLDADAAARREPFRTQGATRETPWAANACASTKAGLAARDPRDPVFAISAHQVLARSLLTGGSMQKSQPMTGGLPDSRTSSRFGGAEPGRRRCRFPPARI
jgi:hypothetical protein